LEHFIAEEIDSILLVVVCDKFDLRVVNKVLLQDAAGRHPLSIIVSHHQAQVLPHQVLQVGQLHIGALLQVEKFQLWEKRRQSRETVTL